MDKWDGYGLLGRIIGAFWVAHLVLQIGALSWPIYTQPIHDTWSPQLPLLPHQANVLRYIYMVTSTFAQVRAYK